MRHYRVSSCPSSFPVHSLIKLGSVEDLSNATAHTTSEDKLKTELADVKMQLREAQAKSTSFSEIRECLSLQSKVWKELAVEVARLKGKLSIRADLILETADRFTALQALHHYRLLHRRLQIRRISSSRL